MKKSYLVLVLTLLLSVLLIGCGGGTKIILSVQTTDLTVGDSYTIEYTLENTEEDQKVIATCNSDIVSIEGLTITANRAGEATVFVMIEGKDKTKQELSVIINNRYVSSISLTGEPFMVVGQNTKLDLTVGPDDATIKDVIWSVSDNSILQVLSTGEITALKEGVASVIATTTDGSAMKAEFEIKVYATDVIAPVINVDDTITKQNLTIDYNSKFDPLEGVKAIDNLEGDISDRINVEGKVDTHKMGKTELIYTVEDIQGNKSDEFKRTIEVVWNSSVTFIGHGGCYSGLMNTKEAFTNAFVKHGYQGIECDVKQTKDGVFVTSHGDDFNGKALNKYTYAELSKEKERGTRGGVTYEAELCTFKEYLQIAKEHNGFCVVELKYSAGINNNDQSRMAPLMKEIKEAGMLDHVIFLASQIRCLEWVRNNGYDDIPCQYLVNSCASEETIDYCVKYNFDISFNISNANNTKEWVDKYHARGVKVACYTFSQYTDANQLQSYIDMGVDFVTVDETRPYEVTLPPKKIETGERYEVVFKDHDGTILKKQKVFEGNPAFAPIDPERLGYNFTGWDKDFSKITGPLEITAQYEKAVYTITYEENPTVSKVTEWESKEDFVNELYTDWFNWLDSNVGKIEGLTKTGDTYKFSLSGKTATWKTVEELKKLDPYDVERTIGAHAYKPVESGVRETPTTPVVPVIDDNYFLNTEPYRSKYIGMDEYLINCISTSYASYSYNYNQASNGRVQIFFRFHQWCNGTKIASLNDYPSKVEMTKLDNVTITLINPILTYTFDQEVILPVPTCSELEFVGWFLDAACTKKLAKIEKGTSGNLVLYAGWKVK